MCDPGRVSGSQHDNEANNNYKSALSSRHAGHCPRSREPNSFMSCPRIWHLNICNVKLIPESLESFICISESCSLDLVDDQEEKSIL